MNGKSRENSIEEGYTRQWDHPHSSSSISIYPTSMPYKKHSQSETDAIGSSPEAEGEVDGDGLKDDQMDDGDKKRRRIQQACKACSLRRVKCNGEKPCQTCLKNKDECVYGQPKKRGPAKGTTRASRKESQTSTSPSSHEKNTSNRRPSKKTRSHSPTSISASSHLLSMQNKPAPEVSLYSTISRSIDSNYHHYRGSSSGHSGGSIYDRDSLHGRSVYRGGTSGWDGGFQRVQSKSHLPSAQYYPSSSSSSTYKIEERPEYHNESGQSPQWPSRRSSQKNLPSPYQQSTPRLGTHLVPGEGSGSDLRLKGATPQQSLASSGPHVTANYEYLRRRSLHDDEIEVADGALAAIFSNLHSRLLRDESNKRGDAKGITEKENRSKNLQDIEITLEKPAVSEEVKAQLFHVYWTVISLYWPLFYRRASDDENEYRIQCEKDHPFLFNAICSTCALVLSESNEDKGASGSGATTPSSDALSFGQLTTIYYARARYYNISASQIPCLESATALILLSLREYGAGRSTEAGRYCWSACRMALDLGLHRSGSDSNRVSDLIFKEEESKRRVYWCAYVLDKTLAAQLGRPPILRSLESDCSLPSYSDEEDSLTTWDQLQHNSYSGITMNKLQGKVIGVSSYFINGCKLAVIAESIIAQYNVVRGKEDRNQQINTISHLHTELKGWMTSTPRHLNWSPQDRDGHLPYILHQQIWAQICMILIHRPYILKGSGVAELNSHAECSRATEYTCSMFEEHERLFGFHSLPSGSVYCLFTAATIALANTTSTEVGTASKAKHQLRQCVRWLKSLSRLWKSACDHICILDRLAFGIDPRLAEEIISAADRADLVNSKSSTGSHGSHLTTSSIKSGSSDRITSLSSDQPRNNDFGQSIEAFWNDMPLGEDFQRWDTFTQSYFKTPTEEKAMDAVISSQLSQDTIMPLAPRSHLQNASNPYLPIYGNAPNIGVSRH